MTHSGKLAWLAVLFGLAAPLAQAQDEPAARLDAATATWQRERLLQPLAVERDNADAIWSEGVRHALTALIDTFDPTQLFDATPDGIGGLAIASRAHDEGLQLALRGLTGPAPRWLVEALARRVPALSLPAARTAAPLPRGPWQESPAHPDLWMAPAVRDGAASYRADGDGTRVRLAIGDPKSLLDKARARGLAVKATLDTDDSARIDWGRPLPIRLSLALPVWLVTPQALVPATLTTLRTGDVCDGGHVELRIAGTQQPAVWAVLFLPDEKAAAAARVKRLTTPAVDTSDSAARPSQVGLLELSFADRSLATLNLVAKRFDTVWGSYAELPNADRLNVRRLSAAGWPSCPPK